jgi:hypothetical protein
MTFAPMLQRQEGTDRVSTRLALSIAVFATACAFYAFTIGTAPVEVDEFYAVLAGASWLADRSFAIVEGEYHRAWLFTIASGLAFDIFGGASVAVARIPALVAAAATVALLFFWLNKRIGGSAATVAAVLLGLSGNTLDVAHFARFYSLQALLILVAAIALIEADTASRRSLSLRAGIALVALAIALHLQPTTIIAGIALGAWVALIVLQDTDTLTLAKRPGVQAGAIVLLVAGVAIIAAFPELLSQYGKASLWATEHQDDALFYVREFAWQMPVPFVLLPVAAALAWRQDRRLASLCLAMILVPLLLHSFAAMKAARYYYYALPFLAALWGAALAQPVDRARLAIAGWLTAHGSGPGLASVAATGMLAGTGGALLLINPSYHHTAAMVKIAARTAIANPAGLTKPADPPWDGQLTALRQIIHPNEFLIVSDDLRTIAYLRPQNVMISASRVGDLRAKRDFELDFRTGRPVIGSPAAFDRLFACRASAMILIDNQHWRRRTGVSDAVADRISRRATAVRPGVPGFHLYRWQHAPTASCPPLAKPRA